MTPAPMPVVHLELLRLLPIPSLSCERESIAEVASEAGS
jgi:hypothetical protein